MENIIPIDRPKMSIAQKRFDWYEIPFDDIDTIEATKPGDPRLYKTPDGLFPSMTSLLGQIDIKDSLAAWRKRVGDEKADRIVEESQVRGNAYHDYCERYLKNSLDRSHMTNKQAAMLFNRIKPYLDEIELVNAVEAPLYSETYMYAGRCDGIGIFKDTLCILDHKNSRNVIDLSKKYGRQKLWKYMIQCCGYARALEEMHGYVATHAVLFVANLFKMNADPVYFSLENENLVGDLDKLIMAWHTEDKKKAKKIVKSCHYYSL